MECVSSLVVSEGLWRERRESGLPCLVHLCQGPSCREGPSQDWSKSNDSATCYK